MSEDGCGKYLEKAINFNNQIIVIFIGVVQRNAKSSEQKDLIENVQVIIRNIRAQ
jgi:hypothetical protein